MAKLKRQDTNNLFAPFFGKAHRERLQAEVGMAVTSQINWLSDRSADGTMMWLHQPPLRDLNQVRQMHAILVRDPLIPIERLYRFVFEDMLGERVSTDPVAVNIRK
jgi:hypothetical protein